MGSCEVKTKFKIGDLVELSDFGKCMAGDFDFRYGIIISEPYSMSVPDTTQPEGFYIAYDVMIGQELFKRIPSEFILRMDKNEEDNDRVEKMVMGDGPDQ